MIDKSSLFIISFEKNRLYFLIVITLWACIVLLYFSANRILLRKYWFCLNNTTPSGEQMYKFLLQSVRQHGSYPTEGRITKISKHFFSFIIRYFLFHFGYIGVDCVGNTKPSRIFHEKNDFEFSWPYFLAENS